MSDLQVCSNVPLEDELTERLTSVAEVVPLGTDSHEAALASLKSADAFLGWYKVNDEFLDAAPKLKVVAMPSVGYDMIDVAAATARGVAICNTPGVLNTAVVDLTTALIIMLSRRLRELEDFVRSGAWAREEPLPELAHDITGKTLGVIGFGRIGRDVARRMQLLGMNPVWYDVFDTRPADGPDAPFRPLDDLLRESDFVTIHMNLNESSRHLIGERELGLMKKTAYIVNTARGPVIDQAALTAALQNGDIAGAGLDVFDPEPPAEDELIVTLPNVIALPHIGTHTHETRKAMRVLSVENAIAVITGKRPPAIVNPEVLR